MASKKTAGKKISGFPKLSLLRLLAWIAVIFLTGLTLFLALRLPPKPNVQQSQVTAPHEQAHPGKPVTNATPHTQEPEEVVNASSDQPYEAQSDDFEDKTRNVDLAILQTLAASGSPDTAMRHRAVEAREYAGQEYYYQNLTINLRQDMFEFLAALKQNLTKFAPEATLSTLKENPRDLEISIQGQPTHHLFFPLHWTPSEPEPSKQEGKLVIIIDDLGESTAIVKRLADLPFPVTCSVLPYNSKARDVAKLVRKAGLELLMHLPCEPIGYPKTANSGPGTLRADMSPALLERTLADNLSKLPEVDGVNNHMGSKLTSSKKAMSIVLTHLKGRGKFFVDSLTTPKSCVREVSSALGMRYYRRHVFLDNTPKENAILLQLHKAEILAKRNGSAVVIGHPYPATLNALESWANSRDMKIIICKIEDI